MNYVLLFAGIGLLIYDAYLELFTDKDTISQWYQKLYPRWRDWLYFVIGAVVLMVLLKWIDPRIILVYGLFWGHVTIANKERYKEK